MNRIQQVSELLFGTKEGRHLARIAPSLAEDLPARFEDIDSRWPPAADTTSDDQPIFVLSAGWRSGSTLLQRMIMADPSTLIWGEPFDRSEIIQSLAKQWSGFTRDWPLDNFIAPTTLPEAADSWIANLYPEIDDLRLSQIALLHRLFALPAQKKGRSRWGLKEVRLTSKHAVFLKWLYPGAKFVFLYRDPERAYASYKPWRRWFRSWPDEPILTPTAFGHMWQEMVSDFIANHERVGGLLVRYEDLNDRVDDLSSYFGIAVSAPKDLAVVRGDNRKGKIWVSPLEKACIRYATSKIRKTAGYS